MDPRGNKGATHKLSGKTLFVLTGSILCQDRCRHNSILESSRFGHLNIVLEKALFLSIFHVIPIEMVWIQCLTSPCQELFYLHFKIKIKVQCYNMLCMFETH